MFTTMTRNGRLLVATIALAILMPAVVSGNLASAQEATPVAVTALSTVTVQGVGSVKVAPDAATATVGVQVFEPNLSGALATSNTQMSAIIEAVKAAGVAAEDIQTSGFYVSIMQNFDDRGNPLEVTGYQVSNQVSLVIRPTDALGGVLDAAVTAGANSIYGVGFFVENPGEAANEARRLAVDDAHARAEVFANSAGMTLGKVVSITEIYGPVTYDQGIAAAEGKGGGGIPIESGASAVTVNIQVTYEMQ